MSKKSRTNELLGYPPDARLLILNADDFGMCCDENEATMQAIRQGLASSCTLMMPCPWGLHGLHLLKETPDIPFGVHLTAVSEYDYYRWGPLTSREQVPTLLDEAGFFYHEDRIPEFLEQLNPAELEKEFRAQIEAVVASGLKPTHVDSHCGIHTRREDLFDMTVDLAHEYGLAVRVSGQSFINKLQHQNYPTNDYDILDSYSIDTTDKPAYYYELLRELPPGLSEWAVHPGFGSPELQAIGPSWPVRQADYNFLMAQETKDIIREEGIIIINYRALQELWQNQ